MKVHRSSLPFLIPLAVFAAFSIPLEAAEILGTVTDQSGGRLSGVSLRLTNSDTGSSRIVSTNELGKYAFSFVQPGVYGLSASLTGFKTEIRRDLILTVGQNLSVNLQLTVGSIAEEVVVSSELSPVDTTSIEISNLIDGKRIEELPLNGRDWITLAEMSPAVVKARSTGYFSSANTQAGRISVAGQRPNATNFMLDGTDMNVYSTARPPGSVAQGLVLGVEAVKEFRIVTSNIGAEHGVKSGGLVEAVSKSGTNNFHGSLYWFNRSGNLDARDFFDPGGESDFRRNQFGGSLGGPIIKNRTFFFFNLEGFRENKEETSSGIVPNAAARNGILSLPGTGEAEQIEVDSDIRPYLDLYPAPNGPDFGDGTALWSGRGMRDVRDNFLTLRIDHILSEKDTIYGRYTLDDSYADLPFTSSEFPGFSRSPKGADQLATVRYNHFFDATFLNDFALGFNRSDRTARLEDPNPGGLSFSIIPGAPFGSIRVGGLGMVGYSSRAIADLVQNVYQVNDTASLIRGSHSLKFGFEFRRFQVNNNQEIDANGIIDFPNLKSFLENQPNQYRGAAEGADFVSGYRFSQYAFYIQDKIDVARSFNLTLGLRYEPWSNVSEADGKLSILLDPLNATGPGDYQIVDQLFVNNPAPKNWAPRLGFAWDLCGDGRTSLRGGFGIFHDSPLMAVSSARLQLHHLMLSWSQCEIQGSQTSWVLLLGQFLRPFPPGSWSTTTSTGLRYHNFTFLYNGPFSFNHCLALRTVLLGATISFRDENSTVQFRRFWRMGATSFQKTLRDTTRTWVVSACRLQTPNPGTIRFQAVWNRRFAQGFTLLASYTFAKSIDEATPTMTLIETTGHPQNSRNRSENLALDKGLSAFDVRHSFTTSFLWKPQVGQERSVLNVLLREWQLGCFLNLASGHPFTPLISFNNSRSGVSGSTSRADRPNLKPGYDKNPRIGKLDLWYDPNAFELPEPGFLGNLGRNTVIGPGYSNVDFTLARDFPIRKVTEDLKIQFRAECFNLLNHPNFDLPGNSGSVVSASYIFTNSSGKPNLGATRPIQTVSQSREIQFGLKLVW